MLLHILEVYYRFVHTISRIGETSSQESFQLGTECIEEGVAIHHCGHCAGWAKRLSWQEVATVFHSS